MKKKILTRRMLGIMLISVFVAGCGTLSEPEVALQNYVRAANEHRCDDALELLSARTKYAIEALRIKPQRSYDQVPVEQYYCGELHFENCKFKDTTLDERQGDTARVSMLCGRTQDGIIPGTSGFFLKYEPRVTEMVYEEGEWRVVEPFAIKIVDAREKEEKMRDEYLRQREDPQRNRAKTVTEPSDAPAPPPLAPSRK